ncbi:MAG: radical SAM protein [Ignavibacteriales bacterium]
MIENSPFSSCYLILTEDCNLRCKYCYENGNRCTESYMSFETAKKTAEFLIENALKNGVKKLRLTFFGGEPLLNLDVMIKFFNYVVDRAKQCNMGLFFSIITNGTIYNKKFEEFILDWYKTTKSVNIQISIDGIPEVQDKNRITANGKLTSEMVVKNILKLKTFLEENKINASSFHTHSVITKDNISKFFSSYKYFKQLGVKRSEFMLSNEEAWNENDVSIYIEQLSLIADYVYKECISTGSLKPYEDANLIKIKSFNVPPKTCEAGKKFCSVTANGDIYPCHRTYFYNRSFKLGNVYDGIIDNESRKTFFDAYRSNMHAGNNSCGDCATICKICLASNYEQCNDVLKCNPLVCSMYKAKWNFLIETKKKFDKLYDKFQHNKCNELTFIEALN